MKSWLATGVAQNYGKDLANGVIGTLAWELLGVAGLIAFAFAAIRFSVDRNQRNPFRVLVVMFGLAMLLQFYGFVADSIDQAMNVAAQKVSEKGSFQTFAQNFLDGVKRRFTIKVDPTNADAASSAQSTRWDKVKRYWDSAKNVAVAVSDNPENVATQYVTGALSGILSTLTVFLAIVFFELFSILRIAIFQVLYAVGPLVIALSILPGAFALLGRWLSAVFEVSSWQLIGAIVFELVAKSAAAHVYASDTDNFIPLCVANLVFVCAIMLIPVIAHRIVGSGFSALGQSIQSTMLSYSGGAAVSAVGGVTSGVAMAVPYVIKGAGSTAEHGGSGPERTPAVIGAASREAPESPASPSAAAASHASGTISNPPAPNDVSVEQGAAGREPVRPSPVNEVSVAKKPSPSAQRPVAQKKGEP
jgi:hypothetical protein